MINNSEKIFNQNINLAYFILHKYFSKYAFDEDAKQSSLLGLWKASKMYDSNKKTAFSTYASRCIFNEMLMFIRKNKKENRIPVIYQEIETGEGLLDILDLIPDEKADIDITKLVIQEILTTLNEKEKFIIRLRINGMNQREIAKELGTSQTNVSRILLRIKGKF